ncbi:MAG TPA: LysM peptidoglycan-binding domain-containing protein [Polyangiaceae bacterium]
MRLLFPCVLLAVTVAPALAQAAPPRRSAKTEARPRAQATVQASRATSTRDTAQPRSAQAHRDVCELVQADAKSIALRTHRIERGDSLSGIAWRYGTSVKALAAANALTEDQIIRTGQELVIPQQSRPGGGDDWLRYAAPPKQRGTLDILTHKSRFRGQVVQGGRVLASARASISTLLGADGERPPIPERLLRLLVRVSDTFGGRTLYIVSGYRSSSYFADSRHKSSEAVDFSIVGVPNVVLRQYLLLLDDVGVGYYPNSSFVHLDVRGCSMQWVDYAGPGEPPRRSPRKASPNVVASRGKKSRRVAELDDIAEKVADAMAEASKPPSTPARPTLPEADSPDPGPTVPAIYSPSPDRDPTAPPTDSRDRGPTVPAAYSPDRP